MVGLFDKIRDIHWRVQLSDNAPQLAQEFFIDNHDPATIAKLASNMNNLEIYYAFNHRYYASLLSSNKETAAQFLSGLVRTEPVLKVMDVLLLYFDIDIKNLCREELLLPKKLEECLMFQYVPYNQELTSYLEADEFSVVTTHGDTRYTVVNRDDVIKQINHRNNWFDLIKGLVHENSKLYFGELGKLFSKLPQPMIYVTFPTVADYVVGKYITFAAANLPTLCDENS